MKAKLFIAALFLSLATRAQVEVQRTGAGVIPVDVHGAWTYSAKIPVHPDTATALARAGKDSMGLIFKELNSSKVWVRDSSAPWGHKWTQMGSGGGGSGTDSALASLYGLKIYISGTTKYIVADSFYVQSRQRGNKIADSLAAVFNASLATRVLKADSAGSGYATFLRLKKVADSLGALIGSSGGPDSAIGLLWGLRKIISGTTVYVGADSFLVVSQARLLKVLDSLNALVSYTNYRSVGATGTDIFNFSTSGTQTNLTLPKIRDTTGNYLGYAVDSAFVIPLSARVLKSDSAGTTGYATFLRLKKVVDSLGAIINGKLSTVSVTNSITGDGASTPLKLSGDAASPGNNKVYGTDGSGVKGWKNDPSGGTSLPTGVAPLYLQAAGTSTYQFGDPRTLDTIYFAGDGQSNFFGNADAGYIGDTASVWNLQVADTVTGGWKRAVAGQYPFNTLSPTQYSLSHDFYFARRIARETGKIVRIIHQGHNGYPISSWFTSGTSQPFLDTLVARINRFVPTGYKLKLFDWDQGESDNSTSAATYNAAWDSVKANLHRRCPAFGMEVPIAVIGMPRTSLGAPGGYQGQDANLQMRDYNLDFRDAYITTDSAYINTTVASNPVHFNADGLKYLGEVAIYQFYKGGPLYSSLNNPGTLPGAAINPGRITITYAEAAGGGAFYDGIAMKNTTANGRTGVHLFSSDGTSTIGYFGLAGPSASYLAANQVVLGTETNSDLLLTRNFTKYMQFTSTTIDMAQKLNYTASAEPNFTNTTAASGAGFTFTGNASNFVNLQLGNSGSSIPNSLNLYVNDGYKAFFQPTGTIFQDSTTITGPSTAKSTFDLRGSMSLRVDSFSSTATLGIKNVVALFTTGATNDTCYLPDPATARYRQYTIKKSDTGSAGTVIIYAGTGKTINRVAAAYVLTGSDPSVTLSSDGVGGWQSTTPRAGGSFYQTVQSNGTNQTQRAKLNFNSHFTVSDNSGNGSTDIDLTTVADQTAKDSSTKASNTKYVDRAVAQGIAGISGLGTSGIFLPSITNVTNAASITSDSAVWSRSDNTVTVDGHFTVTPTSGSANTQVTIGIPVNSALGGPAAAFGLSMSSQTANDGVGGVLHSGTAGTNTMALTFYPTGQTTSLQIYYHYQYRVQ